jgi:hypothetical protein
MARGISNVKAKLDLAGAITNSLSTGSASSNVGATAIVKLTLGDGADNNQANRFWQYRSQTLLDGVSIDIDLYGASGIDIGAGVGKDALGQDMDAEEIVGLLIVNETVQGSEGSTAVYLEVNVTNPDKPATWIQAQTVANGGAITQGGVRFWWQPHNVGLDVENGVAHNVRLTANGGDVTYSIYVLGRHDDEVTSSSSSSSPSTSTTSLSESSTSPSSLSSTSTQTTSSLTSSSTSSSST